MVSLPTIAAKDKIARIQVEMFTMIFYRALVNRGEKVNSFITNDLT